MPLRKQIQTSIGRRIINNIDAYDRWGPKDTFYCVNQDCPGIEIDNNNVATIHCLSFRIRRIQSQLYLTLQDRTSRQEVEITNMNFLNTLISNFETWRIDSHIH